MDISIIICTRNRAESLARTLESFNALELPAGAQVEIVLVDNGSSDSTAAVAKGAKLKKIELRYIYEGRKGKSHALNTGLAQAGGEVLLFTDDDVVPVKDWLERMYRPLLNREWDGVAGRVVLAEEVCRPWMTATYKGGLPFFDGPGEFPLEFIGANMGVHRSVLERVPGFDPEIGPGTLGLCEDTLFSLQLAEAGFRLQYLPDALVYHYPDQTRLLRRHILTNHRVFGACLAYLNYHWRHEDYSAPRFWYYWLTLKLAARRLVQPPPSLDVEGTPRWEASYVAGIARYQQFLIERKRPRNYAKRALTKRGPESAGVLGGSAPYRATAVVPNRR
jgi:glycosyltransferase involved in cell wall biosynthesis